MSSHVEQHSDELGGRADPYSYRASAMAERGAPFDPASLSIVTKVMNADVLLRRLRRKALDLQPDFQRTAGIWSDAQQSRLLESLLLQIPLPAFYMAEQLNDVLIVVDGVQRLTSIARFVAPEYIDARPLRLIGLEYLQFLEGKMFAELPEPMQARIFEAQFTVNLILSGTPEAVMFNVFARLNTGGVPLTAQELRNALIPGPARDLVRRLASSESFVMATGHRVNPTRMEDRELVLRFLAYRLTDPEEHPYAATDGFLRNALHTLNQLGSIRLETLESEFIRSMDVARTILGQHAFRKPLASPSASAPIIKSIFVALSVAIAKLDNRQIDILLERKLEVQERYTSLLRSEVFTQNLKADSPKNIWHRFALMRGMLEEVSDRS